MQAADVGRGHSPLRGNHGSGSKYEERVLLDGSLLDAPYNEHRRGRYRGTAKESRVCGM